MICPCCGGPVGVPEPDRLADMAGVHGQKRIFLDALVHAGLNQPVQYSTLEGKVYSGHSEGGPELARKVMHVIKYQLRKCLAPLGYDVKSYQGGRSGYETSVWLTLRGDSDADDHAAVEEDRGGLSV